MSQKSEKYARTGTLTIQSKLYESNDPSLGGTLVPLTAIPKYAALQPTLSLAGVGNIGMAYVKTPLLNCVDMSQDGVSVYLKAQSGIAYFGTAFG